MLDISIHDNRIISYEVDCQDRRINLHTQFEHSEPTEHTDAIFKGVLAYHFAHDNFSNILFNIDEIAIDKLIKKYQYLFDEGSKYAWPGPWNESINTCVQHFQSNNARAFELNSSYGLYGWVIAESYRLKTVGAMNCAE